MAGPEVIQVHTRHPMATSPLMLRVILIAWRAGNHGFQGSRLDNRSGVKVKAVQLPFHLFDSAGGCSAPLR